MRTWARPLSFCLIAIAISPSVGCITIGDALLVVQGNLSPIVRPMKECHLILKSNNVNLVSIEVQGKFKHGIPIEAKKREYQVEVSCFNGTQDVTEFSKTLIVGGQSVTSVDLGDIDTLGK
ncbi:MAG: hypothetical protein IPG20_20160 [Gammaproteobacteria bacterium]|jgi:hypothetical protein|nr:hypothetical protein [Gammaproteobacteria bacterium]MBK7168800.1 hypothetical protein [Gammaproteobacteria bacterium]MBK9666999.1 hypothetical protein [Gammaproteobacteria bacterium]